jgi:hypothetical protein
VSQCSKRELAGQCQCGAVKYVVADAFLYAAFCHCSDCRRMTGSAFKPSAGIEAGKLRIVEGEGSIVKVGDQSYTRDATNVAPTSLPAARRDVRPVTMGTLVDCRVSARQVTSS